MSDLRDYGLAVERDVVPPDLAELVRVAERRRRRRDLAALGAVVAVVVAGVVVGAGGLVTSDRGASPAERGTSPSTSPLPSDWTARDVVGHPDAVVLYSIDAADPAHRLRSVPASDHDGRATVWFRCSTGPSTPFVSDCPEVGAADGWSGTGRAVALEVSGSRGAPLLARVEDDGFLQYSLEYVGGGRFFVHGGPLGGPDVLVGAGMTEPLPLTRGADHATWVRGADLVLCDALPPCVLDVETGTVTPVDIPGVTDYDLVLWADTTDLGLWGVAGKGEQASVLVHESRPQGPLREVEGALPQVLPVGVPPGVMAYFTTWDCCYPAWHNMPILGRLHVSTDHGRTWRVLAVPDGIEGSLERERYVTHLPTLPDGWEDWPQVDDG